MTFGSEWAVVFGAAVGGAASMLGTILAEHLKAHPERKLDLIRQATLRNRFAASNKAWVPIQALMATIGANKETTIRHLLLVGARRAMKGGDVWGLKEWPEPQAWNGRPKSSDGPLSNL